jgi:hypothetical protein
MNLVPETVIMTFVDEEGDEIVIASDDDLGVMEMLSGNKPYVKVAVQGVEVTKKEEAITNEDVSPPINEVKEEEVKIPVDEVSEAKKA